MAIFDKFTQMSYFEIWSPRYHDNKVLLKADRVRTHNKIVFTRAPSMGTLPWYVSGKTVKRYRKESNGTIWCYAVPLDKLEPLEFSENSELMFK